MEQLLSNPQSITLSTVLIAAVIALWRLVVHYNKRAQAEAEASRLETKKSNEELRDLLQAQVNLLKDELKEEKILRKEEQEFHVARLTEVTSDYKRVITGFEQTLGGFGHNIEKMQEVLSGQTKLLEQLIPLPSKLNQLEDEIVMIKNGKDGPS